MLFAAPMAPTPMTTFVKVLLLSIVVSGCHCTWIFSDQMTSPLLPRKTTPRHPIGSVIRSRTHLRRVLMTTPSPSSIAIFACGALYSETSPPSSLPFHHVRSVVQPQSGFYSSLLYIWVSWSLAVAVIAFVFGLYHFTSTHGLGLITKYPPTHATNRLIPVVDVHAL